MRPITSAMLAILTLSLLQPQAATAQNRGSTGAASQLLRSLTPEQQRELMRQAAGRDTSTSRRARQSREQPSEATPAPARTADSEDLLDIERVLRLRGGDTVLLDVWLRDAGDEDSFEDLRDRRDQQRNLEAAIATGQPSLASAAAERAPSGGAVAGGTGPRADQQPTASERRREARAREREFERERTPELQDRLDRLRTRILDGNPYKLDSAGRLSIPGVADIPLAGLSEVEATKRLASDPALREFRVLLTVLPLERQGRDALKPFGYDVLASGPTTFAPVEDVPVPAGYVVGPGDVLDVQLVGNNRGSYELEVSRSGQITLPDIGPISVAGMPFDDVRRRIEDQVREQLIGTRAVISMGELRAVQVFISGEAEQPGVYTVSPLATVTSALIAAGGVKRIGSLRDIQLRRGGAIVSRLDLYDLLLRGDAGDDRRLLSGDVIFVPPVGPTVSVTGEVLRPGVYELKGSVLAGEMLGITGGLTPDADPRTATLERVEGRRDRVMLQLDLSAPPGRTVRLQDGDVLELKPLSPVVANAVSVEGHVHTRAVVAWREGLRIADVLPSERDLRPNADLNYVLVRRESPRDRRVSVASADLEAAWADPSSAGNIALQPRDRIVVFDQEGGRERVLEPILAELRRQATRGAPRQVVSVAGGVRAPGEYPLEAGMTVADLVRAGGRLSERASTTGAELTRYSGGPGESRQASTRLIDLERAMAGDPAENLLLEPLDFLVVKDDTERSLAQETVTLSGEVRFPGQYPIRPGETLSSLIQRAGGLTDLAFVEGAVFTRQALKERERRQIDLLSERLKRDIAAAALASAQVPGATSQRAQDTLQIGENLLASLLDVRPVGRLVIDLPRALAAPGSSFDVILRHGDTVSLPRRSQEVTVLGEVQGGTSHLYDPRLARDDYVGMSGGLTQKADRKRVYVIRANGMVEGGGGSAWFRRSGTGIRPGDTIVVPLDAERLPPLPLWQAVTTIIYNLAVATAAVNSF